MLTGCVSLVSIGDTIIGLQCSKGRGIILPGGKWEVGETFKQTASRELFEETGLVALRQELVFSAPCENGYYIFSFVTVVEKFEAGFESREGLTVFTNWATLIANETFGGYYELLYDSMRGICS